MNITFNTISFRANFPKTSIKKTAETSNILFSEQKGVLSEFDMNIVTELRELFELAHSSIKSIATSCNTRNSIKNGYVALKKGVAGSRILEFSKIGEQGEDISINLRVYRGKTKKKEKTIIIIGDKPLIINTNGQVEKNSSMKFIGDSVIKDNMEGSSYYSQQEIDNLNIKGQFYALKKELVKYIDYIKSRASSINKIRELRKETISGSVLKYKKLTDEVTEEFEFFKSHINKLSENSSDKDFFRIVNKVKTFHAQHSIMLKKATPDERSLYLSYTKINRKPAMKLFVMDYNNKNIDKSFIIYDNKLAKFFPKSPSDRPNHTDNDFHYFTQEEIDNSGLEYYLKLAKERLSEINDNLERGIEDRLNK